MKVKLILGCLSILISQISLADVKMPNEVFHFKSFKEKNEIKLYVYIEKDYALYKNRINIKSDNNKVKLKEVKLPSGTKEFDKFLNEDLEKYYKDFNVSIKYEGRDDLNLVINYQGCSKGFCYMPTEVKVPVE